MIDDKVADYVQDVLAESDETVIIGRDNFIQDNYSTDRIYTDSLAPRQNLGSSEVFDSVAENMKYKTTYKQIFTVDFVGPNAETNANNFINLQSSERGVLSRETNQFNVLLGNNLTNIKDQKGNEYYNRYQLEIMVIFTEETQIDVPRFDEAQYVLTVDL